METAINFSHGRAMRRKRLSFMKEHFGLMTLLVELPVTGGFLVRLGLALIWAVAKIIGGEGA